jgi:alpha-glucoside transport system permease protein
MTTVESAVPIRAQTRSERLVRLLSRTPLHIALVGIALIWLVPTVGLALTSFRKRPAIASSGWWHSLTQWDWTLKNYDAVINATGMGHAWVNSVIITVPATILPLTLGALAAFGFAWVPFPFRDTLFLLIVALMIVPIQTSLVPLLKLFADWGHLNNGYYGIWLAHTAFGLPLAVFLLRNFRRIVVPLSVPALASFGIFQFLWVWNDLLMALIFVSDPSKQPMTVRIPYLLSTYGQEYNLLAAAAFLLMILPLVVFFSLQRYFVQGLLAGSVKT